MKKLHAKRSLEAWPKDRLVEHILCLEHNIAAMQDTFEIQYSNCVKMIDDMSLLNEGLKKARTFAAMPEEATDE